MLQVAEVSARFVFAEGAIVTFSDTLEVSLDCCICHRCHRTVVFAWGNVEGKCTPTGHAFPGKIVRREAGIDSVTYRLEFWYEPFEDAKYPQFRKPAPRPTWGRVGFTVACPTCGDVRHGSAQNNTVLPWVCHCTCGQVLYSEVEEMPMLSLS